MTSARERAAQYRKEAEICMDFASQISLKSDRAKLVEMAAHWISLAEIAEAKAAEGKDDY